MLSAWNRLFSSKTKHWGAFDHRHIERFTQEVKLFFSATMMTNRSLEDFIAPDFTFTHTFVDREMHGLALRDPLGRPWSQPWFG